MDISKTIRERRSIRKYNATPVAQELIVSLLNKAAEWYEAEKPPQWRCICFGTPESRRRLAESMIVKVKGSSLGKLLPGKLIDFYTKQLTAIPAHLIFIAECADNRRQSDENFAAVCSMMQNVQLLGWEHGLGMLWDTDPLLHSEAFFKEIGLREGERFAGILHAGYFDKAPRARKRTPAERKWTAINGSGRPHSNTAPAPVSQQLVLEMLNEAVWAPNDGLREPWRFIYATGNEVAALLPSSSGNAASAFLLVVAEEQADPHKQEEDYAAVCCLIQNFQLLAKSKPWQVRRVIPDWIYDPIQRQPFGLRPLERIVAVLELGGDVRQSQEAASVLSAPSFTFL